MTEKEYTSALEYLLLRLQGENATDVINEINIGINRGKTVTIQDTADLKRNRVKQSEVGKTQTLPLTSKEAFESAIDYLSKIIIDVPSYADSIRNAFGDNIVWEYDQSHSVKQLNTSESFSLQTITVDSDDLEKAKQEINKIKSYIKD